MPARRSESQEKPRRLTWVHWLFLASGWLAAGIVGLLELPAKIVSFASNYPAAKETMFNAAFDYQRYVGRFSSDPNSWVDRNLVDDGSHPPDEGDIQLAIEYLGNGAYRGEIHSSYMAKYAFAPWSRVMVDGEIGIAGTFNAVVWDIVDGSRVPSMPCFECPQKTNQLVAFDLYQFLRTTSFLAKLYYGQLISRCLLARGEKG